nr:uncharacterized protein LOC108946207 [Nicotiana tomentosiformis]
MLYGAECWRVKNSHTQKLKVAEMRMLRWMCGHTQLDKIRNKVIRKKVGVAPVEDKMWEARLRWFMHGKKRSIEVPVRRCERLASVMFSSRGFIGNSLSALPVVGGRLRTSYLLQTPLMENRWVVVVVIIS